MKLLALAAFSLIHPAPIDHARFFRSIEQVEGTPWSEPGGALGLSRATWAQHSRLPYRYASLPEWAMPVAELHLAWLCRSLRADGFQVTPYTAGVCWRHGFERGKALIPSPVPGYGERVQNLYFALEIRAQQGH